MLLVWTGRCVANTLGMWQVQPQGLPGGCSISFVEKIQKKHLFEKHAGVSDAAVCRVAPYEDVSPSTL